MGQEYWVEFPSKEKVEKYLKTRKFPTDENFKNTLIVANEKTKTDCWLTWKGKKLRIESQIFADQSAWCSAIAGRLIELFGSKRCGADSTGWWKNGTIPGKPFWITIAGYKKMKIDTTKQEKEQQLFIDEAKRLLP